MNHLKMKILHHYSIQSSPRSTAPRQTNKKTSSLCNCLSSLSPRLSSSVVLPRVAPQLATLCLLKSVRFEGSCCQKNCHFMSSFSEPKSIKI